MGVITKGGMLAALPVREGDLCLRAWTRQDVDLLAAWPPYPFPYGPFRLSFGSATPVRRNEVYIKRNLSPNRIVLVGDVGEARAVIYLTFVEIDWEHRVIGNMGFRVHPDWCDRGVGVRAMRLVSDWCFVNRMESIRFDVAASNARAIRCYEKAGYRIVGEHWREDPHFTDIDIHSTTFDFLRPHVRIEREGTLTLRFYWMERKRGEEG
ncbi:MAG TPA: GNAT family N-acetyltransferase [Candidatus Hydrogenedentes bacterium]|nr:GNAT family N-acetyltransferase [Candidatus Hydrogenedentota bacterium]HOS03119.1 GNAT family N-acetyltransferase [Candidatus Hydrogenedentota bacterium]